MLLWRPCFTSCHLFSSTSIRCFHNSLKLRYQTVQCKSWAFTTCDTITMTTRAKHSYSGKRTCENINFDNSVFRNLPIDQEQKCFPRKVTGACYSHVELSPVENPSMVVYSPQSLALLDLTEDGVSEADFVEYFSGNKVLPGSQPAAHCYCGHQYGLFAGQLGDGAAMYLGEVVNDGGHRWELQLKGSGPTPYSRANMDGRKVLRSSIREFIASEAMHFLGIPTTRAATCITSDLSVWRDAQYMGEEAAERGTVVCRLAPSFLRFGSLELCNPADPLTGLEGPSYGRPEVLEKLLHHIAQTHYPQILEKYKGDRASLYVSLFREMVHRNARLVADWQSLGFCHGVINTDNISVVGVTMDYGPFAFMDSFDPDHICNGSDYWGIFSYRQQPDVMRKCCAWLAESLAQVAPSVELQKVLSSFHDEYNQHYLNKMRQKLGLRNEDPDDIVLISQLLDTMQRTGADFTNTFRALSDLPLPGTPDFDSRLASLLEFLLSQCCSVGNMKHMYRERDPPTASQVQSSLWVSKTCPDILPKYLQAGKEAMDQYNKRPAVAEVKTMMKEKKRKQDRDLWSGWLDTYVQRLTLETETGSGQGYTDKCTTERKAMMDTVNPRYVPRNYVLQKVIEDAEAGNYETVRQLMQILEDPYDTGSVVTTGDEDSMENLRKSLESGPPNEAARLRIT